MKLLTKFKTLPLKTKRLIAIFGSLVLVGGITTAIVVPIVLNAEADPSLAPAFVDKMYVDYTQGAPDKGLMISSGWSNSATNTDPFGCSWYDAQVGGSPETGLSFKIDKTDDWEKVKDANGTTRYDFDPYLSGEVKTTHSYKYGFFGTTMKVSNVPGTVSTFFTYTGELEGNPHDEIDIEFLGKDTTKVQFNYFKNGKSHEHWYNLGFDASQKYHHYGFYWSKTEIAWYIDYVPVYRTLRDIPDHECKVFHNYWRANSQGTIKVWAGEMDDSDLSRAYCYYKYLTIADVNGGAISKLPEIKEYDVNPSIETLTPITPTFKSISAEYDLDTTGGKYDISYTNLNTSSYANLNLSLGSIENNKWLSMKVENKGNNAVKMRITINSSKSWDAYIPITTAFINGETTGTDISSDKNYLFVDIPSNSSVILNTRYFGLNAEQTYIMIDSAGRVEEATRSGHVIISDFKVGGIQDAQGVDNKNVPEEIFN